MESIITAATVATLFFNTATQGTGNFVYNADMEQGQVKSLCVFNQKGTYLERKLKYSYAYDAEERLVRKEAFIWNEYKNQWEPDYRLDYAYTETGYSLERRNWDRHAKEYGDACSAMEYEMVFGNVMAVNIYKYNARAEELRLTGNMLVMNPQESQLLALESEICQ
ncbi:MAG: DUF3836 domain-containing protein [Prevotella sp.]|nr:DUF3836 domain-containing protein [Prevotella sp.]